MIHDYEKACHGAQTLMDQVRYAQSLKTKRNETLTTIQVREMKQQHQQR